MVFPDLGFSRKNRRVSFVIFLLDIAAPFLNNGIKARGCVGAVLGGWQEWTIQAEQ